MEINGYALISTEKLERAKNGTVVGADGIKGGVGEEFDEAGNLTNGASILVEYDRLGGFIKKGAYKVKTGSFYDFKLKKPRAVPTIIFLLKGPNDTVIEFPESQVGNSSIPLDLRVLQDATPESDIVVKKGKKMKKDKHLQPDESIEIDAKDIEE